MKKNIKLSDDKLREIIDGFNLDNNDINKKHDSFITTDQGVYNAPDDKIQRTKKE